MEKQCSKCNVIKPIDQFRKGRVCISCLKEQQKKIYQKNREDRLKKAEKYRTENTDKIKQYHKHHYLQNSDKLKKKSNDYYSKSKDHCLSVAAEYRKKNRDVINQKRREKKYHLSPESKIRRSLHNRLSKIVKYKGLRIYDRAIEFLGCTSLELKSHLESKFLPTMSWENHGTIWHIDHIIPCAHFDLTKEEDQKKCFHYTNLQPLFAVTTVIDGITYIGNLNKRHTILKNHSQL